MAKGFFDPSRGVLGDVFVEGARQGARGQDALDGGVVEGAELGGVTQREIDLLGAVARAQEQNLAGLGHPHPGRAEAHQAKELGGTLAHVAEREVELVEIERWPSLWRGVQPGGVEPQARASRAELVARNAPEIGGVHEQLALGDAHRQDVGDVVVGDRIRIAIPGHEAVDGAHAVDDTGGVVRVTRARNEVLAFFGKTLERRALVELPVIDDMVKPVRELGAHVVEVAEFATVEERPLDFPK